MLRSVFFPGVNSNPGTFEAETAQDYMINLPEIDSITQPHWPGNWVLPSQQQKSLLLFLKGQPQVLGVSGPKTRVQAVGRRRFPDPRLGFPHSIPILQIIDCSHELNVTILKCTDLTDSGRNGVKLSIIGIKKKISLLR